MTVCFPLVHLKQAQIFSPHFRSTYSYSRSLSPSSSAVKGTTRNVKAVVCHFSMPRGQLCLVAVVLGNIGAQLKIFHMMAQFVAGATLTF